MGVLGGYLYWKVVLEFWFRHPKCHFWYPQNSQKHPFWSWSWETKLLTYNISILRLSLFSSRSKIWNACATCCWPHGPQARSNRQSDYTRRSRQWLPEQHFGQPAILVRAVGAPGVLERPVTREDCSRRYSSRKLLNHRPAVLNTWCHQKATLWRPRDLNFTLQTLHLK